MTAELTLLLWLIVTLLDLALTHEALSRGMREKNPVMRAAISRLGEHMACVLNLVVSMFLGILIAPWPSYLAVLIGIRGMVVIWNAALVIRYEHAHREKEN